MLVYRSNKPFAGKLREFKGKVWSCGWNVCVVMCKPPSKSPGSHCWVCLYGISLIQKKSLKFRVETLNYILV